MSSVGEGAARGLQAGWQMGMQVDQAERQRARDAFEQDLQTKQFGLQQDTAARQQATADAALARQKAQDDRQSDADEFTLLDKQYKDLESQRQAMAATGQAPTPEFNQQVIDNRTAYRAHIDRRLAPRIAVERDEAAKLFAGMQAGTVDPATVDPAKFYRSFSLATGMTPKDVMTAAEGARTVQQGFEQGDKRAMLQGVNQLVAKDLQRGVGTQSPHGGVITGKEIVDLVPVKDANGVEHPDKVFPVLRVYVAHPGINGPVMENGATGYYDAPLTQNGTSDPNDPPKALSLDHAFDYMGKVGAMAELLQHQDLAAKLAQGEKEVGAQTQSDVSAMNAVGTYALQTAAKGAEAQYYQLQFARLARGEITQDQFDKLLNVRGKVATSADTAARVEGADARADKRIASAEGIAAGHDATRLQATGMQVAAKKAGKTATAPATGGKDLSKLTGEAALNAMDPQDAAYVIRLGSGIADVKNIPARGTERVRLIKLTQQVFPDFNEHDYGVADRAEKAFTTGVLGNKVRSINVAVDHLSTLGEAGKALNNGNMQPLNDIMNYFGVKTGGNAVTDFQAVKQLVADEVVSAIVPGVGALADRKEAGKIFDEVKSPAQLAGAVEKVQKLMGGQINGLYSQYRSGGGKRDFQAFLSSAGKDAMRGVGALPPAGEIPLRKPGQSAYGMQPVAPMGGSGAPAAPAKALTPQDQQAIGWAKANPNDPRAVKILQMHGM